jgi:hypothetical protein
MICVFCKYKPVHWGDEIPIHRYREMVNGKDYRIMPTTTCAHVEVANEPTL